MPPSLICGGSSRFSSTSRLAKMPRSSGQMAMPRRATLLEARPIVSTSRNLIEPCRRPTMPMIAFMVVVLPAPLRPRSVTTAPCGTSNCMPCRMCDSPYQAFKPFTASSTSAMARPEVGFDDLRILGNRGVVAFSEDLAALQDRDSIGKLRHHREIVLDHQDGAVGRHALDERRDALDVGMHHAGGRLVEQHHLGVERERGGDLERALAAVRQLDGDGGFELGQADRGNQLARAGIELVQHPCRAPEVERMSELSLQRDAHVLEHREVRKYRRDLERAHEAHAGDARRRRAGDVAPLVEDAARGRLQEVRQQVKTGGLAGAIGADQGMNAAAPHLEADALDGDEALEFLGEPSGLENDVVGHAHRLGGGRFSMKASIPARPSSWAKAPEITLEASS